MEVARGRTGEGTQEAGLQAVSAEQDDARHRARLACTHASMWRRLREGRAVRGGGRGMPERDRTGPLKRLART